MNKHLSFTKFGSIEDFHKQINYYFSKEIESSNEVFRKKTLKILFDYIIKTDDGSYTINSPNFDGKVETMHNSNGAITESFEKFVKPFKGSYIQNNQIKNDMDYVYKENIAILDICSGLGYNSSALIEEFLNHNGDKYSLSIDMVEISIETLATGLLIPSPIKSHDIVKKAIESKLIEEKFAKLNLEKTPIPENIDISVFCEDARKTIQQLDDNSYGAIFLDPYSPAMAPELCTVEFFEELKRIIKNNGIIATYTLAAGVRFAFVEAGFYIGEGPIFGRKSGGTIASLDIGNISKNIPIMDERTIALSDAGIPFRDPNLNLSTDKILKNRSEERSLARHNTKISSAVQSPIFFGEDVDDPKLKRRILRNFNKVNIFDLKSKDAYYVIEPQKNHDKTPSIEFNSKDRIIDMEKRVLNVINSKL
ncbi:tRNA 5-methylaminomethyl-2-thiouridine biosynthesis bifunctional protein MnmC [Candidatus Methanobinarius endosymbioticus]|uniref:tRNA 5-methylaminomethyl-2-thiouridine biosynthesis bifunctional protein MnmC n=1 Tax=Candidatus Methanobinarius endosymbioticus TaxID=2006182 RepID=A0A366MA34_9EURY|nr:tRNA 5-methylaminomethyl-2-thiouridine biosynthesis bifunctional protein MnmC [Candidatus Methanobinarius endosymbioticus]